MAMTVDVYRRSIMVDFNMLVDTDFGCAIYLQKNTKNTKFFKEHIPKANLFYLQYMALSRKEKNPIEYMFNDEYKGNADSIYGELVTQKWNKVLDVSPTTDIMKLFVVSYKGAGYKITVNCMNQEEANKINLLLHDWNTEIDIKDVSPFFCLYLHDIMSIVERGYNIEGKSIYLYNYSKNHPNDEMDDLTAIHPIAIRWNNSAEFNFISPYGNFKMPIG